ncbi:MAG: hypothetical protein U5L45_20990 [Saprospiraceae bacterium]|nr:hypothetical protein [Saprospiraceae bacterium]
MLKNRIITSSKTIEIMSAEAVAQLIAPAQVVKTKPVQTHAPAARAQNTLPTND